MSKQQILLALEKNRENYLSGEDLAQQLGLSRAAVWKAVQALRRDGYQIVSRTNLGYRLLDSIDALLEPTIREGMRTTQLGKQIVFYETTDSTNTRLRALAFDGAPEGTVVLAEEQTAGKGRLGRSFHSPRRNGIYMSVLLRPGLPFDKIHFLTMLAAVCVCEAIERLSGLRPQIKWVNDLFLQGKKLCGILSEAVVEGESGRLDFVVVGIGINVASTAQFPQLSGNQAVALGDCQKQPVSRCALVAEILNLFESYYYPYISSQDPSPFFSRYRDALCLLGRHVTILQGARQYPALVLDLSPEGGLIVRTEDGREQVLTSGEVSLRLN